MKNQSHLPLYQLFVHPKDLRELKKDIWDDEPVPAVMKINQKRLDIDIAYRGSHIRDFKKKSYHVSFFQPKTFRGAREIHLNAEYKDPSMMRNKLSLDFFSELGTLAPKAEFVFVKVNGKNEGVYLELESVDEFYLTKRRLAEGAIFYAVDDDANFSLMSDLERETKTSLELGYEKKTGTEEDDFYLQNMIFNINTVPKAQFKSEVTKHVDIDKYLRWLAGIVFTSNYDGFVHNYALYRNSETGLFEVIPWDYDATWGRDIHGERMAADYVRIQGFNTLTARILDEPDFRRSYKHLLETTLHSLFTIEYMKPKIMAMYERIRPFILMDPYKKNDIERFDREPNVICEYILKRADYLKSELDVLS
ncbi:spore coat protein CotH [Bacillus vallismortis]|uniref:spore coat protein CotH n=1 Tax=Bacillus vallismortis TaxID=72361 RepID=UPI00227FE552|nr:spore coat protein CotH [Bacillus vallismortis]MCI3984854.1 CotH kinase family protein [Bacillus vallismortis]MCY8309708.1 CotH kinase family protein [Bacillus vallismortis]MCY8598497.1 CotH kinase family protein [Bacillus vallismortis]